MVYSIVNHGFGLTRPSSGSQNSGVSRGTFSGFYLCDPMVYSIVNHGFDLTRPSSCLQNSGVSHGTFGGFYLRDPMVYNITTKPFSNCKYCFKTL